MRLWNEWITNQFVYLRSISYNRKTKLTMHSFRSWYSEQGFNQSFTISVIFVINPIWQLLRHVCFLLLYNNLLNKTLILLFGWCLFNMTFIVINWYEFYSANHRSWIIAIDLSIFICDRCWVISKRVYNTIHK